jgi:methylenetetrahydrofolate reductase (NADPH)
MSEVATAFLDVADDEPIRAAFDDAESGIVAGPLLGGFSLETTAGASAELAARSELIAPGTRITIPFLDRDDLPALIAAARSVRELGFHPVPHVAARRIESAAALAGHLRALRGVTDEVFLVGGDPVAARGPFPDAVTLLRSGLFAEHGIRHVGLPGYPAGHPLIEDRRLWADLAAKAAVLREQGLAGHVTTQFATPGQLTEWLDQARARDIRLPVRVGVPGAAGVPRGLAARLGAQPGAKPQVQLRAPEPAQDPRMPKGVSVAAHLATAHRDPLRADLKFHFSPFGALRETVEWIAGQ